MHDLDAVRRCECRSVVMPTCWYHTSSLCPLSKVTFHRAVIINFKAAHDHSVVVLLDVGAWIPVYATLAITGPGVCLPAVGDETIVEEVFDQPVTAIAAYTCESEHTGCTFIVGCNKRGVRVGVEIIISTKVECSTCWATTCYMNGFSCMCVPYSGIKRLICRPSIAKTIIDGPRGIPFVIRYRRHATG